jgi:hypothetical protein
VADNNDKTPAPEIQPLGEESSAPSANPTDAPVVDGNAVPAESFSFTFDPIGFISTYPLVVPLALVALWIGAIFGWKKLTLMYNMKGQPLAPLRQSLKAAFVVMFREDKNQVFVKSETLAAKTQWFTWTLYWKALTALTIFTLTVGGFLPFGSGNWLLGIVVISWLGGIGHVKKIFAYRHRILMQMFEVASSEMKYPKGAELNPWGYVQVSGWREMYFPLTTAVMYPAKYRSEDARNRQAFEINFNGTVSDQNAWTYTWESSNNRVICEPVPFIPKMAPYPFPDRNDWNIFPLGLKSGGEEAVWNVSVYPHCLVAGTTGSGKSVTQGTILLHALQSPDWRVVLIDPKRVELSIYRDHPNVLRVATELEDSVDLIQQVEQEMMSRFTRMESGGVKHFRSLPDPPPAILLMVDETFALLSPSGIKSEEGKQQDEIKARIGILIGSIARLGRAAGIHQVLATQRPDAKVLPGEVKANLDARIAQGRMDNIPSLMTLDSDAATRLPPIKGRAILRAGSDQSEFQAYFLAEEHLPQVLEMTAAMAQGDTSFLEDQEEPVIEQQLGPKFSMPKISLPKFSMPSASKFAQWFEKRKAIMEENERRAGRSGESSENKGSNKSSRKSSKEVKPAKTEAPAPTSMSDARADVDFSALSAEMARRPQTLDFGNGLFTDTPQSSRPRPAQPPTPNTLDFPDFENAEDDDDFDEMFTDGFSDEEAGYVDHLEDVEIPGVPTPVVNSVEDVVPQSPSAVPMPTFQTPPVAPATLPPLLPPAPVTPAPVKAAPLPPGLSVQDVVRRAAERGVPIPASELLAALRAEAARQQAAPTQTVSAPTVSVPAPMEPTVVQAPRPVMPRPKVADAPAGPVIPAPPVLPNRPAQQPAVPVEAVPVVIRPPVGAPPAPPAPRPAPEVTEAPWMPQDLPPSPSTTSSPFAPQKPSGGSVDPKSRPPMPPAPPKGPNRPDTGE